MKKKKKIYIYIYKRGGEGGGKKGRAVDFSTFFALCKLQTHKSIHPRFTTVVVSYAFRFRLYHLCPENGSLQPSSARKDGLNRNRDCRPDFIFFPSFLSCPSSPAEAGLGSTSSNVQAGGGPFHETRQARHWHATPRHASHAYYYVPYCTSAQPTVPLFVQTPEVFLLSILLFLNYSSRT